MELVDVLDNRNEYTGSIKGRKELSEGEFRNLVHIWIINSKGEFLLQKRSKLKKHFPNKWSVTSGCTLSKESLVETCRRECKEELNVEIDINNLEYEMTFKKDPVIVNVFVLRQDVDIRNVVLQEEEVSDIKFMTKDEIVKLIDSDGAAGSIKYFEFLEKIIDKKME